MATSNNGNGTWFKISISSIVIIMIAIVGYFNSSKVDAEVFNIHKDWNKQEISDVKQELQSINKKIDLLLTKSGVSKSDTKYPED